MSSLTCPKCGAEVKDGDICPRCLYPIHCPNCAMPVSSDNGICESCGFQSKQVPVGVLEPTSEVHLNKVSLVLLIIGTVIIVLAVIVGSASYSGYYYNAGGAIIAACVGGLLIFVSIFMLLYDIADTLHRINEK